jgi:hypothetical protein
MLEIFAYTGKRMNKWRNNHTVRLAAIGLLILLVAFIYFRNVNVSNLTSVDGAKAELSANYKPDTMEKKILLGAGAALGAAFGLEASQNDWDLKKLYNTKGDFKASRVLRDKEGNILTDADVAAGKQGKYTDEYDCKDFQTQPESQKFFDAAGGVKGDTNRLDGNKDGVPCQALPAK